MKKKGKIVEPSERGIIWIRKGRRDHFDLDRVFYMCFEKDEPK
jgi:hypothetical protein